MGIFEKWCATFTGDLTHVDGKSGLTELEVCGDLRLLYSVARTDNALGRAPIYHVWKGDSWIISTAIREEAYKKYLFLKHEMEV
jgi:hypothetical protein